jgi:hypothetical protein
MSNTITSLIPDVYSALDVVSRELVGFIPAMTRDATTERAAVGQTVRSFVAPAAAATDITPAVTPPDDGDQTIGNVSLTISKARRVPFRWNGEQSRGLNNGGPGVRAIQVNQIAQAIRTLTNEMEADCAGLQSTFSRAYGTATTAPFSGSNSAGNDTAQLKKILDDNGAPVSDRQLILSTTSGAALRSLAQLQKQNETNGDFLQNGVLLSMNNFMIRESAQIKRPAAGTASSATTDNAGYAIGATSLTLASAGTGTLVAGDIVTFAGDTNKYEVVSGDTDVSNGGTLVLAAPGLRVAMSAATKAITVVAISERNMAFRRSALVLAARLPALPDGGDLAVERSLVQDPVSGFAFEIARYPQYRQMQWEISAAWGVANVKPEHTAILLGA